MDLSYHWCPQYTKLLAGHCVIHGIESLFGFLCPKHVRSECFQVLKREWRIHQKNWPYKETQIERHVFYARLRRRNRLSIILHRELMHTFLTLKHVNQLLQDVLYGVVVDPKICICLPQRSSCRSKESRNWLFCIDCSETEGSFDQLFFWNSINWLRFWPIRV